jgi:hypothetical protein
MTDMRPVGKKHSIFHPTFTVRNTNEYIIIGCIYMGSVKLKEITAETNNVETYVPALFPGIFCKISGVWFSFNLFC